jgi:hypothetical protein
VRIYSKLSLLIHNADYVSHLSKIYLVLHLLLGEEISAYEKNTIICY